MPELEPRIKLAVLGAGYWGTKLCKEYSTIENTSHEVQLRYVVDSSDSALDKIRKELEQLYATCSSIKYASDYNITLNDEEIEAVHIALPNQLHYQVARQALEKGKNVLIEKPIATTSREAFKLARLAEERGLVLQVGHIFRFNNAMRTVKEVISSGRLGRIFYANLNWVTYEPLLAINRDIVFDLAPHPVDILNYLLDEWPIDIHAIGNSYVQKNENAEEVALINLEYPDEVLAHLYLSWIHHGVKERTVNLIGEKATLTCNALNQTIQFDQDRTSSEVPVFPFNLTNAIADNPRNNTAGPNNTIRDMQYHFISQIRRRGPQMSSALIGARTVQVLEEITATMRAQRGIPVKSAIYPKFLKMD